MKMEAAPAKFHRKGTKDSLDSDFFTLDPNLAPALRITYAGVPALPKPSQNVEISHARRRAKAARQGKNDSTADDCARLGDALAAVPVIVASGGRPHAAYALRAADAGPRGCVRSELQNPYLGVRRDHGGYRAPFPPVRARAWPFERNSCN